MDTKSLMKEKSMKVACFSKQSRCAVPIHLVPKKKMAHWLKDQPTFTQNWLKAIQFCGEVGSVAFVPDESGKLLQVIYCISDDKPFWEMGSLPMVLPEGVYFFESDTKDYAQFAIAWGLGSYQFERYKKPKRRPAQLFLPHHVNENTVLNTIHSVYEVRDLINTPTDDMGPTELAKAFVELGKQHKASVKQIVGEKLLKENFASIHTVGRASDDPPRLVDLRWGNKKNPLVVLVGKGVCFDSGGLDIKVASGMLLMKKDMGGAAHVLGLARMIMEAKLPIYLRVLVPIVENVISGNAYKPGDVITSRKGLTIEIGNTDAEGRVILADALTEAVSECPDLLIDISTLTGAARVALGTELPAMFSNDDKLAEAILHACHETGDPVWRLPLFGLYRDAINSSIADINNNASDSYGGAITAALFLKEFVPNDIPWAHFDLMAWNLKPRPGRPQGGEAMALRGLFAYLTKTYGKSSK